MLSIHSEFCTDRRWALETPAAFPAVGERACFLNGGRACLMVIADVLQCWNIREILLPAYLCPTIENTLRQSGLDCRFYRVNEDFSIDLDDLARLVSAGPAKAVYFINYFGFTPAPPVLDFLQNLRHEGLPLVEDNAQAGFNFHSIGDFTFNSLRKFAAYDGAYLTAPLPLEPLLERYHGRANHRLPLIREYRRRLGGDLFAWESDLDELEALYRRAEEYYESERVVLGDPQEREGIEHLDWPGICAIRRENYRYLLRQLEGIPEVTPLFSSLLEDNMPLGLPVYISGVSRDRIGARLAEARIRLVVHWENIHADPRTPAQRLAAEMSQRILTLPIDQNIRHAQIDYLVEQLIAAIEAEKLSGSVPAA